MSDSSFAAVSRYRGFLEVIDAEWMTDCLSDDELDLPNAQELPIDDDDTDNGDGAGGQNPNKFERWTDLALDSLQPE